MTDPKATFLKDWIGNVEKNMTLLSDGSKLMVQKMTKSKIKNTTFAESLKRIAETEVGRTTADSLSGAADLILELENQRQKVIARLEFNLVEKLRSFGDKIKHQRKEVQERNSVQEKLSSKKKDLAKQMLKSKRDDKKVLQLHSQVSDDTDKFNTMDANLDRSITDFERAKYADMKEMLTKYVELNLYYHSRAIEHFSAMYKTLQAIDAEADAATIARKLTELGQTRVVDDADK